MNRTLLACCASCAITLVIAYFILCPNRAKAEIPNPPASLHGFDVKEIRFDESLGNKEPDAQIPATWKLVAVSNGESPNSNNLWFQDTNGTIYQVQGFTTGSDFILKKQIGVLNVGR